MVSAISSFVDVCYLARRSDITESTLRLFDASLAKFYDAREAFRAHGVRPEGFSLPRQHSLSHYHHMIQEFGAPNGICSSITESRHITAVKKPWRNSNRYEALGQMLLANQRLDKLAAARADFTDRGMIDPIVNALTSGLVPPPPNNPDHHGGDSGDESEQGEDHAPADVAPLAQLGSQGVVEGNVVLARTRGELHFLHEICQSSRLPARTCPRLGLPAVRYPRDIEALGNFIKNNELPELTRRFLFDQLNRDPSVTSDDVPLDQCPEISGAVSVFHSALATFYSPSDDCGLRGMRRERIRCTPLWRKKAPRKDCAFVVQDQELAGMKGMAVVRIHLLFSLVHDGKVYPCALAEWFLPVGRSRDPVTGLWRVRPDIRGGKKRFMTVLHLKSFLRAAHLLPHFGTRPVHRSLDFTHSLDAFASYYVNRYADHHAHEIAF